MRRCAFWDSIVPDSILDRLISGPLLLFDGAIGSRLIQMGLPSGSPPEAWVLQHPEKLAQVHQEYVAAGSEVIAACTFGANRLRLRRCHLEDQLHLINVRAVEIARQAAAGKCWVAADMGPTGEFFQPHGSLTPEEAQEIYAEQAEVLAQAGVDFFLLETHYDLREARINLAACRDAAPHIPVAALMTFNRTKSGFFTVMGDPAIASLHTLYDDGAFLVGSNCTQDAAGMLELSQAITSKLKLPLLFQPNAGSPQLTPEGIVYPQKPDEFAACMARMIPLGVRAVGGCCGTDAEYIRLIKERMPASGP